MADKESIDVLMTFIDSTGNGVAAECTSVWDKDDTDMMKDFQVGKVFEVDDFDFAVNLGGSETAGGGQASSSSSSGHLGENSLHAPPGRDGARESQNAEHKKAASKRAANYFATGIIGPMPPEVKEVTITKQVDVASTTFLSSCLSFGKKVPPPPPTKPGFRDPNLRFQKAVLVKRKFTGNLDFHEAFLRVEFRDPLIIGIDWDEGEIVKEKIRFICRGILVAYRPQNQDGTLGQARTVTWFSARKDS